MLLTINRIAPDPNPYRKWVPRWLRTVVVFIILIPILTINGAYTGSNIDISSYLGVLSEDINMAYYSSSAGMAIAYLIIPRMRIAITSKTAILTNLIAQVFLSFICARSQHTEIIVLCSFLIGAAKGFALSETIRITFSWFTPSNTRNQYYTNFYPISLALGQISYYLTGQLAYLYNWQYMYYFMIIMLLIAIIAVIVCMTFTRPIDWGPFKTADWFAVVLLSICFISFVYVVTYGKTLDWFNSRSILWATVLIPVTGWLFVRRQFTAHALIDMNVLRHRNSVTVYTLAFLLMFFCAVNVLTSTFNSSVLKLDSLHSNALYLWTIPGFLIGFVICYILYKRAVRLAWMIFIGFGCFSVMLALIYFRLMPTSTYHSLYILMFLRGIGMLCLYVAFALYGVAGLQSNQIMTNAFFLIGSRAALAPATGSSILYNWVYHLQQSNFIRLMAGVDMQNPLAASKYTSSLHSALAQGHGMEDAQRLALNSIYQQIQVQATTVSVKTIAGWMLIISLVLLVGLILYFFHFQPVKLLHLGGREGEDLGF